MKATETKEALCVTIVEIIMLIAVLAGVGLLLAFPVKWTWNTIMPYLFGLPTITWGKAWCLHFLAGCLIKGSKSGTKKDK